LTEPPPTEAPLADVVPDAADGERIDRFVAMMADCSRSEAVSAIAEGKVDIDGRGVTKASQRVSAGEVVSVSTDPRRIDEVPQPDESVPVEVLHVDEQVIVVDKAADVVVHPAPGHHGRTLVNGLLARFPELAGVGDPHRPGIVHRLDRFTSGLMVVARSPEAYTSLVSQLADHSARRTYTALVLGHPEHPHGIIDAPVGRSRRNPLRMTVAMDGRPARTHYTVDELHHEPRDTALLTCELETGRTHQIRVHLNSIGHPVAGDETYGGVRPDLPLERPFLHARRLEFAHPAGGDRVQFESQLPEDLASVLAQLD
jgi:23S rRNA pseudouridine1911/1915/1917 synthase